MQLFWHCPGVSLERGQFILEREHPTVGVRAAHFGDIEQLPRPADWKWPRGAADRSAARLAVSARRRFLACAAAMNSITGSPAAARQMRARLSGHERLKVDEVQERRRFQ